MTATRKADPRERRAYHEAGHAVASHVLGVPIARVSIRPGETGPPQGGSTDESSGAIDVDRAQVDSQYRQRLEAEAVIAFAGPSAEDIYLQMLGGQQKRRGAEPDVARAGVICAALTRQGEDARSYSQRLWLKTCELLSTREYGRAVVLLAERLVRRRELSGKAATALIESAIRGDVAGGRAHERPA